MNAKHDRILERIFTNPVPANIRWQDIESLLLFLGAKVSERAGSRIAVILNGEVEVFHRPHPRPETKKGAVMAVRRFLQKAGVR